MSKNLNHRPLSASNRKGAFSHDPSPLHSSKVKKDNQAYFQPPELDSRLRISSRQNVRKNEGKVLGTNLFINNLNVQINPSQPTQKKVSAPLAVAITNRKNSKQYAGLSQKEELALAEYRNDKIKSKDGRPPSGFRDNIPQSILGNSLYEIRKNPVAIIPKHHTEDLSRSNYIPKFKGSDPNNKFMLKSPPKIVSQIDPYSKFKKPNGRNQKSFDVNAGTGPIGKYTPYLNSTKPPSTANNSPRNRDSENRVTKTENLGHISQGIGPKSTKAPLERNLINSKIGSSNKSPIMVSKHRKTPSLDSNKRHELMQQKTTTPPILDRVRKSADQGDYWQGTLQNQQQFENFSKSSFRFAIRTRAGVAPNGTRKINQDSFIFHTNYGKKSDRYLLGVCDGHGMNGHFVSGFVKESLPIYLLADPNFENNIGLALTNAFELCHQKLLVADFDCKFSGTTSIVLLIEGNKIISANAGDSRAVMGSYSNKGWACKPLSIDHKPDSPLEAQRILKNGGRIEPFKDYDGSFVGPARVWLAHQDIPGLAMARSIGDIVASTVGVSCLPEIKEFTISNEDKFLIVASDGVWEFIESIDVVRLIVPFYEQNNIEGACDYLLGLALKRWQEEEEVVVDDITLIIIFF